MKPITDLLNDLITEHGSAGILRERLIQLKEKMQVLVDQNIDLRNQLEDSQEVVRTLTAELRAKKKTGELDEISEKILRYFFTENRAFYEQQIADVFNIQPGVARHHLAFLKDKKLIWYRDTVIVNNGPRYLKITDNGCTYMVEHGLT